MTISTTTPTSKVNFYAGRHVFLTGATGMVGMAYISRLALDTPVERIYALVRGGKGRLWRELDSLLDSSLVAALKQSNKITAYDGDITAPNFGMVEEDLEVVRANVSIFIHGASTINLKKGLDFMAQHVLHPSIALGKFARSCQHLELFVYISTAFASTFLRSWPNGSITGHDAVIKEAVNPIRSGSASTNTDVDAELSDLATYGKTPEYSFVDYPWAYSYIKHLTERVIERDFRSVGLGDKLLVFRPSVIAPAVAKPHPCFERPGSSPYTNFVAGCVAHPPEKMVFSTRLESPSKPLIDVIPIDIVVNRLIIHTAAKSTGHVHAVAGEDLRTPTEAIFEVAQALRQPGWPSPKFEWRNEDWKSRSLCKVARLFSIAGSAFVFEDERTKAVWAGMDEADQRDWPLFHDLSATINCKTAGVLGPNVKRLIDLEMEKSSPKPEMTSKFTCKSLL